MSIVVRFRDSMQKYVPKPSSRRTCKVRHTNTYGIDGHEALSVSQPIHIG